MRTLTATHDADASSANFLLKVSDVEKHFDGVAALAGVSLQVGRGEIVGLIGPNGSGKTTLLNVISGVLSADAGEVRISDVSTTQRRTHEVARMGVGRTFQQIRLFGEMTVAENVAVGAVSRGLSAERDRIVELARRLGLQDVLDQGAGTLSYGTQRRVEIARTLAGSPGLLLLDEPAAGMNDDESDDLLDAIRVIRTDMDCAVLIVDHDLRLIMRLCDRIHVLAEGRTLAEGSCAEVQRDPAVVEAYLGSRAVPNQSDSTVGGHDTSQGSEQ